MAEEYGRFDRKFEEERQRADECQARFEKIDSEFEGMR